MNDKRLNQFITQISSGFIKKGYRADPDPQIPGVRALLYAWSPERVRLTFEKVEDHFLFMDWDSLGDDGLSQIIEMHGSFSVYVNQRFKVPHAWRIQIPNLAIIAVSRAEFPFEVLCYARASNLTSWIGGEVGQVILVEVEKKRITSIESFDMGGRYKQPGTFALVHASNLIREVCNPALGQG